MFKKIINYKNFWRFVVILVIVFVLLFCIFKWVIEGFSFEFIFCDFIVFIFFIVVVGFIYGFFVIYGKFWKKLKEN